MRFLYLSEIKPRISESHILEVVLHWRVDIFSALHIVADGLLYQKGFFKEIDVLANGIQAEFRMEAALEGRQNLGRIHQRTDRGGEHIHQVFHPLRIFELMPFQDVLQIRFLEEALQVGDLLLLCLHRRDLRKTAIGRVVSPTVVHIPVVLLHEFRKGQRVDMDLVPAPAEGSQYVVGEKFRIAPCHVHVHM